MTLPQIRTMMTGGGAEQRVSANAFPHLEQLVAARVGLDGHLVTLKSLVERYSHAMEDARSLASVDIIQIEEHGSEGATVTLTDAELISIWGEMRKLGFIEALDFHPKMLDFYLEAAKFVAGWEARTFLERTEGRIAEEAAAAMIEPSLPLMLNFFGLLRRKEFMRNIGAGHATGHVLSSSEGPAAPSTERALASKSNRRSVRRALRD
jgi:hypothetical protein